MAGVLNVYIVCGLRGYESTVVMAYYGGGKGRQCWVIECQLLRHGNEVDKDLMFICLFWRWE